MNSIKRCPQCGEEKDLSEFYIDNNRKDGHTAYCKQCIAMNSHEYYLHNKEKCKERYDKWVSENKEYVRERSKQYRRNKPEIEFNKQKRYRETHKEKLYLKGKKYRETHKDYFNNKCRERKLSQQNVSDGTITLEAEQILFKSQNGKCDYCDCDLNMVGKHLDHIIPLSRGGLHTITNVHWVCPKCNMSKNDKTEEEWFDIMKQQDKMIEGKIIWNEENDLNEGA